MKQFSIGPYMGPPERLLEMAREHMESERRVENMTTKSSTATPPAPEAQRKLSDEAERMIDDKIQQGIRAALLAGGVARPDVTGNVEDASKTRVLNRQIGSTTSVPGRKLDDAWKGKSLGEFAAAIAPRNLQVRNDYSSLDPSAGGFLVPEILRSEVAQSALERSIVRRYATVFPTSSSNLTIPVVDATSNATTVFGGISGSWTEEGAELAESEAKFGRVRLSLSKLSTRCDVPNELLEDTSLDAFLMSRLPQAIAWFEDVAFLTGNGVGQPLGILSSPALVSVAKETNQPAASIVWENIVKMWSRLTPSSAPNAIWLANPDLFPELATMSLSVGTGGSAIWLGAGAGSGPTSILGRPLIFTEKLPTAGTVGDILLCDLSQYYIADKGEMRLEASPHAKFTADQTVYRCISRCDGRPGILSAVTPHSGSTNTLSPFVALATRS